MRVAVGNSVQGNNGIHIKAGRRGRLKKVHYNRMKYRQLEPEPIKKGFSQHTRIHNIERLLREDSDLL